MARPRKYQTEEERRRAHTARQRAYQERQARTTLRLRRAPIEQLTIAVQRAAERGDPWAGFCRDESVEAMFQRLAQLFDSSPTAVRPESLPPWKPAIPDRDPDRQGDLPSQRFSELCREAEKLHDRARLAIEAARVAMERSVSRSSRDFRR